MEINLLLKFGEKKHLEEMRKTGLFYCNTITYFANVEDNLRGDPFESVCELNYFENATLQLKPLNDPDASFQNLKTTKLLFQKSYDNPLGNIFCMSYIKTNLSEGVTDFYLNEVFKKFKCCLMILRQDIFFKRLNKELSKMQFKTCMKQVEYLNLHKHTGLRNLFQKDIKHSWQEELRLVINTNKYKKNDPFTFSIGSIEDISEIWECAERKVWQIK